MKIPFTKAHGARNDFLLTWREELPEGIEDFAEAARAICDRNTGAGADGWLLISQAVAPDSSVGGAPDGAADGSANGSADCSPDCLIELWNSDGSRSEISGNGTRCAAALMVETGHTANEVRIATGAGVKKLRLLERRGRQYSFEMNMGRPRVEELHAEIEGRDAVVLNVGNPQCAFLVDDFDFDWAALGARVERMPRFPNRTNVSFVRTADAHTVEARFFERGAGVTMSSGTGSTGAAAAAHARGWVESPVRVDTPAGPLQLRWEGADILLAGPAEIVARGEFYWEGSK
jgi:diaminopimelate epimerase